MTVVVVHLVSRSYCLLLAAQRERGCSHYHLLSAAQDVKILWLGTWKTSSLHLGSLVIRKLSRSRVNKQSNKLKSTCSDFMVGIQRVGSDFSRLN